MLPMVTVFPPISRETAVSLECVSVVMIARAAMAPASGESSSISASFAMPPLILSMGSCCPMTPVDATSTAVSGTFSISEAAAAVSLQ